MAKPQPISQPYRLRRRPNQSGASLIRKLLLVFFVIIIGILFFVAKSHNEHKQSNLINPTTTISNHNDHEKRPSSLGKFVSYLKFKLPGEDKFMKTIKECSGSDAHCGQHKITDKSGSTIQRIAIISPPSEAIEEVIKVINSALVTFYGDDIKKMNSEIEIIRTTHVPPYGYGKSHGYTKIVRVMSNPLILQVMSAFNYLKSYVKVTPGTHTSNAEQLKQLLRQVIRWNCRLSHVSAHTTMININLSSSSIIEELKLLVRLIVDDPEQEIVKGTQDEVEHENQLSVASEVIEKSNIDGKMSFLNQESIHEFLSLYNKSNGDNTMIDDLDAVLKGELESTDNLKKWPCLSFWNVGSVDGESVEGMDDLTKKMAELVSPSCSSPFTKCSVKRDRCEEMGDAKCSG